MSIESPGLITVAAYGRGAASARVRLHDWVDHLQIPAVSWEYAGTRDAAPRTLGRRLPAAVRAEVRLRRDACRVDDSTVLLSRAASPFSNGGLESRLLSTARRGVYDFDDSLAHYPDSALRRAWSRRRVWQRSLASADQVIAGNATLAEEARAAAPAGTPVTVVPSCIEPSSYRPKSSYEGRETPRVVWLGSPATEAFLVAVARSLRACLDRVGGRITVISAGEGPLGALAPVADRVTWSADALSLLADADVGIMPLPDTPFTRGKCAYKLLQYGATALPVVASPVGVNRDVVTGCGGWAPATDTEWDDALTEVLTAPEYLRASAGRAALAHVQENYSFASWEPTWRKLVLG
ncbi:hypothetical protein [Mumia zhuanghuii]|uniref:hypothetical protein n=1 Tax=Mumia zhuanghuii TaxID=2585211 RepID=UPI0036288AE6